MKNKKPSSNAIASNLSVGESNANQEDTSSSIKVMTSEMDEKISLLSYEESLKALDELLELLQNDTLPVEDLQRSYLLGSLYLDHCEKLLNNTEQEIIELNKDRLQEIDQ